MIYSFDVTISSHDLLKRGVTEARLPGSPHHHHRIVVEAENETEGSLIAAQMASCQWMVTGVYLRV